LVAQSAEKGQALLEALGSLRELSPVACCKPQVHERDGYAPGVAKRVVEGQTFAASPLQLIWIAAIASDDAEIIERHGDALLIIELPPEGQAFLVQRSCALIVILITCQVAGRSQRLCAKPDALLVACRRGTSKRLFQPPAPFAGMAADLPEPPERRCQSQPELASLWITRFERPAQCPAQVVVLQLKPGEPCRLLRPCQRRLGLLGQLQEEGGVASLEQLGL